MKLFIYGTLKRGHQRASLLDGQEFLGEVRTVARYRLVDTGSYPALVLADTGDTRDAAEGGQIVGELWHVDAACLAMLDRIEDVPRLFRRLPVELLEADGPEGPGLEGPGLERPGLERPGLERPVDVEAYLYQRSVDGFQDCGDCWP